MMEPPAALAWLGIALCVIQSACFSGLNLSLFGISALNLEAQAAAGDADARRLLALRRDPNFLLTTVLWGNVGTNVLLTLLADSVLAGVLGFVASTFVITFGGEIVPQAYFSRHALRMASSQLLRASEWISCSERKPSLLDESASPVGGVKAIAPNRFSCVSSTSPCAAMWTMREPATYFRTLDSVASSATIRRTRPILSSAFSTRRHSSAVLGSGKSFPPKSLNCRLRTSPAS